MSSRLDEMGKVRGIYGISRALNEIRRALNLTCACLPSISSFTSGTARAVQISFLSLFAMLYVSLAK